MAAGDRAGGDRAGLPPGPALTCCAPAAALQLPGGYAAWEARWADAVYHRWAGDLRVPPVAGAQLSLNWSDHVVTCPGDVEARSVWPPVPPLPLAVVWAWEVLERLPAPNRWLRQVSQALTPGGLLVCTMAAWHAEGPDVASGAAQRQRIYSMQTWRELAGATLPQLGLSLLGRPDWTYHGDVRGDHTVATVVAVRRAG